MGMKLGDSHWRGNEKYNAKAWSYSLTRGLEGCLDLIEVTEYNKKKTAYRED
jgi:hypothetical protein